MRSCLLALALLAAAPARAETDDHGGHLAERDGLRILHAWTPATPAGADALFYMEIENTTAAEAVLTGGMALDGPLQVVGFRYDAGGENWTALPGLPIPAGGEVELAPRVLALRRTRLPSDLAEGADLDITIAFGDVAIVTEVEIGAADATRHSHAGHTH
jgi:hypothetical protein